MDLSDTQSLLKRALRILGNATLPETHWALGGGTVLAHYYQHRRSKDIDIFIDDAQCLARLSPRLNDLSEDALDYAEMGHYISLTFPEDRFMEALVENDRLHTPLYSIENAEMLLPKGTPYRGQERQICLRLREQYIKMRRC